MGWKATGIVPEGTAPLVLPPVHPIITPGAKAQYEAALVAVSYLIILPLGTGDFTVSLKGSGEAYPTASVTVEVEQECSTSGGTYEGKAACISVTDVAKIIPQPPLPTSDTQFWNECVSAAQWLMANGMIGNIRPFEVRLLMDLAPPIASLVVEVRRPVAEGYGG